MKNYLNIIELKIAQEETFRNIYEKQRGKPSKKSHSKKGNYTKRKKREKEEKLLYSNNKIIKIHK